MTMISWHYTPGLQLAAAGMGIGPIILSRKIATSIKDIGRRERPAVWFSDDQEWERTAAEAQVRRSDGTVIKGPTAEKQAVYGQGLYRFGLPREMLLPYPGCCRDLGISLERRKSMNVAARRVGAVPTQWRAIDRDVPLDEPGLTFGYWLDGGWKEAPVTDIEDVVVMCSELLYPLTLAAMQDHGGNAISLQSMSQSG